jgi:hypothetical protein
MIARIQFVQLASDERGNATMLRVADEALDGADPGLIVEVREHAGWWLRYTRVVGSANDCASYPADVRAWRAGITSVEYLPSVRRGALAS